MSDITVRRVGLGDVQHLAAVYVREAGAVERLPEPPLPKGAMFWAAFDADGTAVGYAAGQRSPAGLVLGPVYVVAAHRRGGVAGALLAEIERWTAGTSIVEVSVAADNQAGVRFLEASGYARRRVLMAKEKSDQQLPGGSGDHAST